MSVCSVFASLAPDVVSWHRKQVPDNTQSNASADGKSPANEQRATGLAPPTLELILFVGLQGSGKTTYYHAHFAATHVHVSKDLMKNARDREQRQRQVIEEALRSGRSVVVDNTNPTPLVRAPLIESGRRQGARVIVYLFELPVKTAVERNRQREGRARVPDIAIYRTSKRIVAPLAEEGFDEMHVVATV